MDSRISFDQSVSEFGKNVLNNIKTDSELSNLKPRDILKTLKNDKEARRRVLLSTNENKDLINNSDLED